MEFTEEMTEFIAARSSALLRYGYLLTGDHARAEDLVQDALIKACASWKNIREGSSPEAYVRRTMYNLNVSWWRKVTRRERDLEDAPLRYTQVSDGAHERAEHSALLQAIEGLPPKQRAAVVLRYYEDQSDEEIAEVLDCSPATVRSHLSRARNHLKEAIGSR